MNDKIILEHLFYIVEDDIFKFKSGDILAIEITDSIANGDYVLVINQRHKYLMLKKFTKECYDEILGKVIDIHKR